VGIFLAMPRRTLNRNLRRAHQARERSVRSAG
jgi:hypothetical protein